MSVSRIAALLLLSLFISLTAVPAVALDTEPNVSANQGFIHATVTWPSGESKTGFLRWGDEEAFWKVIPFCTPAD
ncbi:MAG: hypothetical protein KOO60_02410 [Gemmatimonadales bacterium]|nr:hypothetical protein [Gemmatimonadales bacterium]